jgi:TetR/AcrR family transcriptional regulator
MPLSSTATTASPRESSNASKQRIFDTAVRLFMLKGFAATGMREIAREARVNLGTINYFYGSKIGLLEAILDDFFGTFVGILQTNLAGDDAPEIKLRRTLRAVSAYFTSEQDKMLTILTELHHDTPEISERKAYWVAQVVDLMKSQVFDPLAKSSGQDFPIGIIGPVIPGLAASRFLFRPIVEKVLPSETADACGDIYPDIIAELYLNGLNGLVSSGLLREGRRD